MTVFGLLFLPYNHNPCCICCIVYDYAHSNFSLQNINVERMTEGQSVRTSQN